MRFFAVGTKIFGGGLANIGGGAVLPRPQCRTAPVVLSCVIISTTLLYTSVTRRYSVETMSRILKHFTPSGSHTILVLRIERYGNTPTGKGGNPVTGASNPRGV